MPEEKKYIYCLRHGNLEKREFVWETEKSFKAINGYTLKSEIIRKETGYTTWFKTLDECFADAIKDADRRIEMAESNVNYAKKAKTELLQTIEKLKHNETMA